jgi:hypothetical protein
MNDMAYDEQLLTRAAAATAWPAAAPMRSRVLSRIAAAPPREVRRPLRPAFVAIASAVAVVAALGAMLAVPSSRDAVADLFDIEGSDVQPLPATTALPLPTSVDPGATPVTSVPAAATLAGFDPALPGGSDPNATYVARYGETTGIILEYDGFTLWQVPTAGSFEGSFDKGVPSPATIEDVAVNGRPGRWISRGPHHVGFVTAAGEYLGATQRTVERNTLIWNSGDVLYRLETDLPLQDALAIASELP